MQTTQQSLGLLIIFLNRSHKTSSKDASKYRPLIRPILYHAVRGVCSIIGRWSSRCISLWNGYPLTVRRVMPFICLCSSLIAVSLSFIFFTVFLTALYYIFVSLLLATSLKCEFCRRGFCLPYSLQYPRCPGCRFRWFGTEYVSSHKCQLQGG